MEFIIAVAVIFTVVIGVRVIKMLIEERKFDKDREAVMRKKEGRKFSIVED